MLLPLIALGLDLFVIADFARILIRSTMLFLWDDQALALLIFSLLATAIAYAAARRKFTRNSFARTVFVVACILLAASLFSFANSRNRAAYSSYGGVLVTP